MIGNRKGLSAVVTTMILIALALIAVAIIWVVINNLITEELGEVQSCVNVFDKVDINDRYTCYNLSDQNLQFSLSLGDIDLDKVLVSISGAGITKSFEIGNIPENITGLTHYSNGSSSITAPKKNSGLTYVYNMSIIFGSATPDRMEISPVVDKKQCGVTDSLVEFPNCLSLS